MTRSELRANVRANLNNAGVTFFQDADINASLQDAYNDICTKCQCIVKSVTLNFLSQVVYYDFLAGNPNPLNGMQPQNTPVTDFLGVIAIFNNNTNLWLRDDLNKRDLDKIRIDWELWTGQSQYWCPISLKYIAVAPRLQAGSGTFILWYWAQAPLWNDENDTTLEPLVANDMQDMFEEFATADLLCSAEEPTKAANWWGKYLSGREEYKQRCRDNARADLLQRI